MASVQFEGQVIALRPGETVLAACLRQGVALTFSCRAGSCHACLMRAVGAMPPAAAQTGIADALRRNGYFLPCKCRPENDLQMLRPDPADIAFDALLCERVEVSANVSILRFECLTQQAIRPGQHVQVVHPSGVARSYSVASLLEQDYFLELHIARHDGGLVSSWLRQSLALGETVRMQAPAGTLNVAQFKFEQPLLMIATGTGAAPLWALARLVLNEQPDRRLRFLHGARHRADLYLHEALQSLASEHPNFHYMPCLSREMAAGIAYGRVYDLLATLELDAEAGVLIAGRPEMVDAVSADLQKRGIRSEQIAVEHFRIQPAPASAPQPDLALWAALGQGHVLQAALRVFYARVFADPLLSPYFRGVTEQRLIEKQYSFLKSLITGSRDYFGQRPRNAHHWMVISDRLFDYRLQLMRTALIEQGLGEPWLSRCHALEERFRADIVKTEAIPREVDGQVVRQDGLAIETLAVGTLCDHCQAILEPGMRVRFHQRLGTVFCSDCAV